MWPMAVVMIEENSNNLLEMLSIKDQEAIQTLRANRSHEPLRDAVGVSSRLHRQRAVRHKRFVLPIPSIRYVAGRFN